MNHYIAKLLEKADDDLQAGKWIREFSKLGDDSCFAVIKISGASIDDYPGDICEDLAILSKLELYAPIVYGWGDALTKRLEEKGIRNEWHEKTNERITTAEIAPCMEEIAQEYGSKLVNILKQNDVPARLCPNVFNAVPGMLEGLDYKTFNGVISSMDISEIEKSAKNGIIPVVCPLGNFENVKLNINADTAAKELVYALKPLKYIEITNKGGVLDFSGKIIPGISIEKDYDILIESKTVSGGMKKKLDEAREVLYMLNNDSRKHSVQIAHPKNIIKELFTDLGQGTYITF